VNEDAERFVIDSACGGSQQAWRQLFEWHFDAVFRFSLVLAGGRQDLAEEVSQQTFIIAARRVRRFRPDRATFRAWLHGIARNRYLTLVTKEQRRRRHESVPRSPSGASGTHMGPDTVVHEVLARLPLEYRCALEDKYLKRLTMREMAESRGRTVEAIESLLRRARDRFAPLYESVRNER
jgi:RNA polymerase sigma-70 factor (ECF subfamily)